jgi:hypothetical protein
MRTLQNTNANAVALADAIMAKGHNPVFDMDGVFIDASHRQICKKDGSLDLDKYREMSTAMHIRQDKELPLIQAIYLLQNAGVDFSICTARVLCEFTKRWLDEKGIFPSATFSRDGLNDTRRDYELKGQKLSSAFTPQQRAKMVLIDDNLNNCLTAKKIGMKAVHVPFEGH